MSGYKEEGELTVKDGRLLFSVSIFLSRSVIKQIPGSFTAGEGSLACVLSIC